MKREMYIKLLGRKSIQEYYKGLPLDAVIDELIDRLTISDLKVIVNRIDCDERAIDWHQPTTKQEEASS